MGGVGWGGVGMAVWVAFFAFSVVGVVSFLSAGFGKH